MIPWHRPWTVLRLATALMLTEIVRSGFFVGFFPLFASEQLSLSVSVIGLIASAHYLSDAIAKSAGGWLSERVRLGWVMLAAGLMTALAVVTLPRGGVAWMIILSALWGITVSPLWPSILTYVSRDSRPGWEARGVTLATAGIGPAFGGAMLLTGYIARQNLNLAYWLLLAVAALLLLVSASLAPLKAHPARLTRSRYDWRQFFLLVPAAFVQTMATGLLSPILFLFIKKIDLGIPVLILIVLVGGLVALSVLPGAARWTDHKNPRYVLIPGLLIAATGFAAIGIIPMTLGVRPIPLALAGALLGLGFGLFFPGWNGLVVKTLPQADRAAAWGALMSVEALGFAVGPTIGGLTWDLGGPAGPFVAGGLLMAITGGYYLWQLWRYSRS